MYLDYTVMSMHILLCNQITCNYGITYGEPQSDIVKGDPKSAYS